MRRFQDGTGGRWDVVVGRESWGALYALFAPLERPGDPVRQSMLGASGYDQANRELESMSEAELERLLEASVIREDER